MTLTISLSPNTGQVGDTITVYVDGFEGDLKIQFGDNLPEDVIVSNGTINYTIPEHSNGPVDIMVIDSNGSSSALFTVNTPSNTGGETTNGPSTVVFYPTIDSIVVIIEETGTFFEITGNNFIEGDTQVYIEDTSLENVVVNDTSTIRCILPLGLGEINVKVTTLSGTLISDIYSFTPTPTITSIFPNRLRTTGDGVGTITGTNLTGGKVNIGGTLVNAIISTSTTLSFMIPAHAVGEVDVFVSAYGSSNTLKFTYSDCVIDSISPNKGSIQGNDEITIIGINFTGATVTIDGVNVPPTSITDTEIKYTTSAHLSGPVEVVVTSASGKSAPVTFTYGEPPTITSISPTRGVLAGFNPVTITGTNLTGGKVNIGGKLVNADTSTSTTLSFMTPAHAVGEIDVFVSAYGSSNTLKFTYSDCVIESISPNKGSIHGNDEITITGINFTGAIVTIDGVDVIPTSITDTEIKCTTPSHLSGPVDVVVTSASGKSLPVTFTYGEPPTITSISPTHLKTTGNGVGTITGTNLTGGKVNIGGTLVNAITSTSTTLSFMIPAHAVGEVDVYVVAYGSSNTLKFTYSDCVIDSISPNKGSIQGNDEITIIGINFTGATVTIDGVDVTPTSITDTQIKYTTSAHLSGPVEVVVTSASGKSAPVTFTYGEPPTITSIFPTLGILAGGNPVTITGTNLTGGKVNIGGILVTADNTSTSTTLSFMTPAHAVGEVDVYVVAYGSSNTLKFTYSDCVIESISPNKGSIQGNDEITITGRNFTGATVTIDGVDVIPTSITETQIKCTTPSHLSGPVDVVVTSASGKSKPVTFTYGEPPTITSISPTSGKLAGGNPVTITGTNLTGGKVTIDGELVTTDTSTSITLTFTTPAHAVGEVDVFVTAYGSSNTIKFTYVGPPTLTSLSPNKGSIHGNDVITIVGTNLTGGIVSIDGYGASITNNTGTSITCITSDHISGDVNVIVSSSYGTSNPLTFTYSEFPKITSISNRYSFTVGGTLLTMIGKNFNGAQIIIGNTTVNTSSNNGTVITCITPPYIEGEYGITVLNSDGPTYLNNKCIYNKPPTIYPNTGLISEAKQITITHQYVPYVTSIQFGPTLITQSSFTRNNNTITFTLPNGTLGPVDIIFKSPIGNITLKNGFTYISSSSTPESILTDEITNVLNGQTTAQSAFIPLEYYTTASMITSQSTSVILSNVMINNYYKNIISGTLPNFPVINDNTSITYLKPYSLDGYNNINSSFLPTTHQSMLLLPLNTTSSVSLKIIGTDNVIITRISSTPSDSLQIDTTNSSKIIKIGDYLQISGVYYLYAAVGSFPLFMCDTTKNIQTKISIRFIQTK